MTCIEVPHNVCLYFRNAEHQLVLEIERTETFKKPFHVADDVYMDMYGMQQQAYSDIYASLPGPYSSGHHFQPQPLDDCQSQSLDDSFHAESNIYATLPTHLPSSTPYASHRSYDLPPRSDDLQPRSHDLQPRLHDLPPRPRELPPKSHDPPSKSHDLPSSTQDLSPRSRDPIQRRADFRSRSHNSRSRSHDPRARSYDRASRRIPQCVSGELDETKENIGKFPFFICGGMKSSKIKHTVSASV